MLIRRKHRLRLCRELRLHLNKKLHRLRESHLVTIAPLEWSWRRRKCQLQILSDGDAKLCREHLMRTHRYCTNTENIFLFLSIFSLSFSLSLSLISTVFSVESSCLYQSLALMEQLHCGVLARGHQSFVLMEQLHYGSVLANTICNFQYYCGSDCPLIYSPLFEFLLGPQDIVRDVSFKEEDHAVVLWSAEDFAECISQVWCHSGTKCLLILLPLFSTARCPSMYRKTLTLGRSQGAKGAKAPPPLALG